MLAGVVEGDTALILAEVGGLLILLGLVARVATALRVASAPLFLLTGLIIGEGGVVDLDFSQPFIAVMAEVGAILLLLFLGLEFSATTIVEEARRHRTTAVVDLVLNATPGALCGYLLGWDAIAILAMAGVTYVSSSGIATQVAREMGWRNRPEWKSLVAILVLEDLAMAPYLPVLTAFGTAASLWWNLTGVTVGLAVVTILLVLGSRGIHIFSGLLKDDSGVALLLTTLGLALAAGGIAALLNFSSLVAAFLVGLLITGELAQSIRNRLRPLRDLFAAVFFVFFGFQTDPTDLPRSIPIAAVLVAVTWGTKVITVWYALGRSGATLQNRWLSALRGGSLLSARGEFSVAIGGLVIAMGIAPQEWRGLVAAYVILSAMSGPLVARLFDPEQDEPVVETHVPY